jgi:hypothetical protein
MASPIASVASLFEQQIFEFAERAADLQRSTEGTNPANPNGVTNFIGTNTFDDNIGIATLAFRIPYTTQRNATTGAIERVAVKVFEDLPTTPAP